MSSSGTSSGVVRILNPNTGYSYRVSVYNAPRECLLSSALSVRNYAYSDLHFFGFGQEANSHHP